MHHYYPIGRFSARSFACARRERLPKLTAFKSGISQRPNHRVGQPRRPRFRAIAWVAVGVALLAGATPTRAQFLQRSVVIEGARILTMDKAEAETGNIVIQGMQIDAVGPSAGGGLLATKIDAAGLTVTPGLIDGYGVAGLTWERGDQTAARSDAYDQFNRYDLDSAAALWREGVTTVYVAPRDGKGIIGRGALVSLGKDEAMVGRRVAEGALHVDLGSDQSALARLKTLEHVRQAFADAREYRKKREAYEEELTEYVKKVEERAKKAAAEEKKKEDEKKAPPSGGGPKPGDGAKPGEGSKPGDGPKPGEGPKPGGPPPKEGTALGDDVPGATGDEGFDNFDEKPPAPPQGQPSGTAEKKEEELKKPEEPAADRDKELLLKVLDGEIPLRIRADRHEDILNALALADEFGLEFTLEGAGEAQVVPELAKRDGLKVFFDVRQDVGYERSPGLPIDPWGARRGLEIPIGRWGLGSGIEGNRNARFLLLEAASAKSASTLDLDPLRLLTRTAADLLGQPSLGRIRKGARADLVLWSGDPLQPRARVVRVIVGGETVFSQ